MKRKYPILGYTRDVDDKLWDIRDVRETKHGFDLLFGTPAYKHASYYGGLPRLIATKALSEFWDVNRLKGHGFLFDLPAGRTTLKRVRRRLGFNFDNDWQDFWEDRQEDLANLNVNQFAAKHGVAAKRASDWRQKLLGRQARPIGWWIEPQIIELLLSDNCLREIGSILQISTSQVHRLRERARRINGNKGAWRPHPRPNAFTARKQRLSGPVLPGEA